MTPKIIKLEKEQDILYKEYHDRKSRGLDLGVIGYHLMRNQMSLNRERAKRAAAEQYRLNAIQEAEYEERMRKLYPGTWKSIF